MSFYESPSAPKTKTDFRWKQLQKVLQSQTARSFTTYRIFHTQSQAIEFQQSNENLKDLRIFSYEHNMSQLGSRKFIVANLRDFYDTYMKLPDRDCHHYELIQQAHNCHLYYDIEYDSRHNVGTSGNELVQILKTVTRKMLYQLFDCDPASIIFVELDSTSEIKFSRHLIVRMPGLVFKDNIQVGMFIKLVVASIKSSVIDTDLQKLVVFNKNGECLMFDESVYTKNRNFRLIKSSKLGKTVYLKEIIPGPLNFERFKQTLVCEDMHKLQIIELNGKVDALDVCRMQPIRFLTNPNQIESGSPWIEIDFYIISQIRNNTDPNSEIKSCLYLDTCKTMMFMQPKY